MQLFYLPGIRGNDVFLDENESRHCIRVLRLGKGSRIHFVDGEGGFYEAEIAVPDQKRCRLLVINSVKEFGKRNFYLHIAIAPTKNTDRIEWFAEKATEIGVDEITPVFCSNSERKVFNPDRLEKIATAAMKQSLKAYLPKINPPVNFQDFIKYGFDGRKLIAHCNSVSTIHMKEVVKKGERILILIGPEGDFTIQEVGDSLSLGFTEVSLGGSRLRTETAGMVACHIVNLINE